MMRQKQKSLFVDQWQPHARARQSDPVTSHLAAKQVEESGSAATQRAACLEWVRRNPENTSAEIAAGLGLNRHQTARRLPELLKAGLVAKGSSRTCRVGGTYCLTWHEFGYSH